MVIRLYRPSDAAALAAWEPAAAGLPGLDQPGGRAWVALQAGRPVGYAAVHPVPGLLRILDLEGFVAAPWRRQGIGGWLLDHVRHELRGSGAVELSHAVADLGSPAAHFLQRSGFAMEHEEWRLALGSLEGLPPPVLPPGLALRPLPPAVALSRWRELYDASFRPHPWYQPYGDDEEVAAELALLGGRPDDLLFLLDGKRPVGFAWLRRPEPELGEVEPLGLIPACQGRGLGRPLLLGALAVLRGRGARRARIGAWATNTAAIRLYQALGFRHRSSLFYLAAPL